MKTVSAYQCDYCRKYGKNITRIIEHEERCYYNPRTRSCGSCVNLNDWTCSRGVEFEKKKENQTPRLRTRCIMYENTDDVAYGPDDDCGFYKIPF